MTTVDIDNVHVEYTQDARIADSHTVYNRQFYWRMLMIYGP